MGAQLTFLHAADLHLGAPFRGLRALSGQWADRLLRAIPEAFDRMIETALSRNVDFVVMSGDIFDQAHPSYGDFLHFFSGIKRLDKAGIATYLCTGNHDPYTSWQGLYADLPSSAHLFPADAPGYFMHSRDGYPLCLVGGRGYFNQTVSTMVDIAEGITREAGERACGLCPPFAVGVLHTGLHLDPVKAPTSPATLLRAGMDYWALGHIHMPYVDKASDPHLVFPGCIQGRDIKETGPRGCCVVTLEEGRPNKLEFVPLASVVWQRMEVDVSQCTTLSSVFDAITRELFFVNGQARCEEMVERITLVGCTDLHGTLRTPGVIDDLRKQINDAYPTFFCDVLIDQTRPVRDRHALESEGLFPAVVMRQARAQLHDTAASVAYLQDAFLQNNLVLPGSCVDAIGDLIAQAEESVLDYLDGYGYGSH